MLLLFVFPGQGYYRGQVQSLNFDLIDLSLLSVYSARLALVVKSNLSGFAEDY